MSKIRKAITSGIAAGAAAAGTVLAKSGWQLNSTTIAQALGAFVAAGLVAAYATWRVPNAT